MSSSSRHRAERPSHSSSSQASSSVQNGESSRVKIHGSETPDLSGHGPPSSSADSSHAHSAFHAQDDIEHEAPARKRHRSRLSSGFLLDSVNPLRTSREKSRASSYEKSVENGHASNGATNPKQSLRSHGKSKARTSIGRSPLGIEVLSPGDSSKDHHNTQLDTERRLSSQGQRGSSVFGPDQTQVVSLALSLSENRKRQFSTSRIAPDSGSRRIISSGTIPAGVPSTPFVDDNLLRLRKRDRRNDGASSGHYEDADQLEKTRLSFPAQDESGSNLSSPHNLPSIELNSLSTENVYPSEATILRAQKAKTALELTYEYRRLLQYLPKLPVNPDNRPSTPRNRQQQENAVELLGRQYNPLQYIRNRKVRARDRKPLDAEVDGWKDVDAVRSWVDTVADDRELDVSSSNNRFPLPPFPPDVITAGAQLAEVSFGDLVDSKTKESRSRSDWTTNPWDLIADAYWLEQGTNINLLEDRKGRKLYAKPKAIPQAAYKRPTSRRSTSMPRSMSLRNSVLISESAQKDSQNLGRGRQLHQRHHSFTSTRSYSTSRDRKVPWRRLIGPQSPSSTEDSGSGNTRKKLRRRPRMSSRDRQDSIILEKQVMDLMAREAHSIDWDKGTEILGLERSQYPEHRSSHLRMNGEGSKSDIESLFGPDPESQTRFRQYSRDSLEHDLSIQTQRSSFIFNDVTDGALNSSIAINVSPPRSRSRSHHPLRNTVSIGASSMMSIEDSTLAEDLLNKSPASRFIGDISVPLPAVDSPSSAHLSPKSAESARRIRGSSSGENPVKNRSSKDFESRLRGLLKGTKISGIVGNPVAKVGDLIWKRDSGEADVFNSPATYTPDGSETDEPTNGSGDSEDRSLNRDSRYKPTELPVFRSPFRGRNGKSTTPESSLKPSPEIRDNKKPERFIQNAPPPLDMRSVSPSPAPSRVQSPDSPARLKLPSPQQPDSEHRPTERRHAIANSLAEEAGVQSYHKPKADKQLYWPNRDELQYLNITKRLLGPLSRAITDSDISLLRAMVQCVLVTSGEINRQFHAPSSSNSRTLQAVIDNKLSYAHKAISEIQSTSATVTSSLQTLSQTTMPTITARLRALDTHMTSRLTAAVRSSGKDADELSAELATTRTLEVKKLNDALDAFARRRRRRFRWVRRGFSWGLEWTLLGTMWWVWLVVVCLQLIRGFFRGLYRAGRWLLWV